MTEARNVRHYVVIKQQILSTDFTSDYQKVLYSYPAIRRSCIVGLYAISLFTIILRLQVNWYQTLNLAADATSTFAMTMTMTKSTITQFLQQTSKNSLAVAALIAEIQSSISFLLSAHRTKLRNGVITYKTKITTTIEIIWNSLISAQNSLKPVVGLKCYSFRSQQYTMNL